MKGQGEKRVEIDLKQFNAVTDEGIYVRRDVTEKFR
jgi:hypothetical protein